MDWLTTLDWQKIFVPHATLPELLLRGSLVYLSLVLLFRFGLKRQAGSMAIMDLLLVIIIGESVQNALIGENFSVPDGLIVVSVLIAWDLGLNWLSFHVPAIGRLLEPKPLPLIRNGKAIRKNMKRELVTHDELMSQLRLQGVDSIEKVKQACMESDGKLSVIPFEDGGSHPEPEDAGAH